VPVPGAVPGLPTRGVKKARKLGRAEVDQLPVVERGSTYTVFDAGNGSRVARLFSAPANARDSKGQWAPIDTTLVRSAASGRVEPKVAEGGVSFADSSGDRALMRAGEPGRRVGLGLAGGADRAGVLAGSAIRYPGVLPDADVEFRLAANLVKTTLVLGGAPASGGAVWRFPLQLDPGLTPALNGSGGVSITDAAGVPVALVPTPVMWDSKEDKVSGDPGVYGPVSLALEGDAASGWVLVVSADEAWLASAARVYPVHVDPSVQWTAPNQDDATFVSGYPNLNYQTLWNSTYGMYENRVGRYDAAWGEGRALLHFNLSPILGANVQYADLSMYFMHAYTVAPTWAQVRLVNTPWSAGGVTWNTQPALSDAGVDFTAGRAQWASVDVTGMLQQQTAGNWQNQGYLVWAGSATGDFKRMAAMENTNGAAPSLDVAYNFTPTADMTTAGAYSPGDWASPHLPVTGLPLSVKVDDRDGNQVATYFKVGTTPDVDNSLIWSTPWQPWANSGSTVTVTVPPDRLPVGRWYYWTVVTYDGSDIRGNGPRAFGVSNTAPSVSSLTSPAQGQVVTTLTPPLTASTTTDAEGDPVKYWFRVSTGSDGVSGLVVSSGWLDNPAWTVPAGVLKDGVPYTWTVTTSDKLWQWHPETSPPSAMVAETRSDIGRFRVDLKQGLGKLVPTDALGGVSVNLFNGNAVVSAASPTMTTLGGDVGVSLTYNSAKKGENGLTGSYFDGLPAARDFPAGDQPELVRTDAQVDFNWESGSPFAPAIGTDQYRIRWTGFVTAPETGSYLFGATHDDGLRITVGTTSAYNQWQDALVFNDYTGATPISLTAGTAVPITVEYFENAVLARLTLLVKKDGDSGSGVPLPASWLSTAPPALPVGWSLSADIDGEGGYTLARVTDAAVALTDATGSTHTYTKRSDGSYQPPTGEYGTLTTASDGTVSLVDDGGSTYRFDKAGVLLEATAPVDDRKPASAKYTYTGAPARLSTIEDPVSGRVITLTYQRDGETCPTRPNATYDAAPPPGMLCQIKYPNGSTTGLFYSGGQLAAILDPGDELTQFQYAGPEARLSGYRDPSVNDWITAGASRDTDATWSQIGYDAASRVQKILSPEPTGATTGRVGHYYDYPAAGANPPVATVKVNNSDQVKTTYTMDGTGRPVASTNPTGQTVTATWNVKDQPVWSSDHTGRVTATQYDALDRPTDTWGPFPDACFSSTTDATGVIVKTPIDTPACKGSMPHTRTGYDEGLTGLAATWWNNLTMTGTPAGHSTTATPGAHGTNAPHATIPLGYGYSARYSGHLTLPVGTYTFATTAASLGGDGLRLYIDDQLALSRWDTYPSAVTADQPTGYWRLGDAAGSPSAAATLGISGTYAGSPALAQAGALTNDINTAASFPGTSTLTVAAPAVTDTFTMEAWVKPTAPITLQDASEGSIDGINGQRWAFFPTQGGAGAGAGLSVGTNGLGVYEHGNGYLTPRLTRAANLGDGQWHHVAVVYSGKVSTLFLDGTALGSSTISPRPSIQPPTKLASGDYGDYEGGLDEIALYPTALDGGKLLAHYQASRPTFTSTDQATGPTTNGRFTLTGGPTRIRVDYKHPTGASALALTAQQVNPSTGASIGAPITVGASNLTPGYGLTTSSTTDDSGVVVAGVTEAPSTSATTSYTDTATGIDPALGLATASTVDAGTGKLNLTSTATYEPYGTTTGSLLRPLTSTPPSGAAAAVTTGYYGPTETRSSDGTVCGAAGAANVNQGGMAKSVTNPGPATGSAVVTEVIRDLMGRTVAAGYRDGAATPATWACTTYDARGRVASQTIPAYGGTAARTVTTNYAASEVGGLPTVTVTETGSSTSTTSTTTDLLGRVVSYSHTVPGTTATITTATSYDSYGRVVTSATTSSAGGPGSVTGYTYLPDGRVEKVRWATTVAAALTDTTTVATLTYDPVSKDLASVGYASGSTALSVTDLLTRDQAGNPVKTTWTVGSRVFTDTLTRSRVGRIVRAVTTDSAGTGAGASSADWSYVFDGAARLTRATLAAAGTRPKLTLDYGYASSGGCGADTKAGMNGSRTSFTRTLGATTAQTSSVCTDHAARTTAVTSSTGGTAIPATQITWDARGNATRIGNQTWTYDAAGRVTTANEATGLQALTYTRDATGRVTKRAATSTTGGDQSLTLYGYSGDGDTPETQLTPTGAISEAYLTLPGGALLTRTTTGTSTWAISNLHGDLIATLTVTAPGAGTTTGGFVYDPYGQPLNPATLTIDTTATPDTRAGAPTDAWAGIHQRAYEHTGGLNQHLMGARTYLPALGIFTSTDPIPGGNTTPYTYPQDPINHQDYSGLFSWSGLGRWVMKHKVDIALTALGFVPGLGAIAWAYRAYKIVRLARAGREVFQATRATSWLAGRMWVGRGGTSGLARNGARMYSKGEGHAMRAWRSSARKGSFGHSSNLTVSERGLHTYRVIHINHRAPIRGVPIW